MTDSAIHSTATSAFEALPGTSYKTPDTPDCRAMENLLGKTLKCTLDDGRAVTGSLVCVDRLYVP